MRGVRPNPSDRAGFVMALGAFCRRHGIAACPDPTNSTTTRPSRGMLVHFQLLVRPHGQGNGPDPFVFHQHAIVRRIYDDSVGALFVETVSDWPAGFGSICRAANCASSEILRFVNGGRRPDHLAGVVLKSFDAPVEIRELVIRDPSEKRSPRPERDAGAWAWFRAVPGVPRKTRTHWFSSSKCVCCGSAAKGSGACAARRRPYREKSPTKHQKRFAMSTWHEKILDHEHE